MVTTLLASIVRGEWPAELGHPLAPDLIEAADRHGVAPLVADRLQRSASRLSEPELTDRCRALAAADVVREAELRRLLARMYARGVPVLVFKGAQLAYTLYERPDLRPRLDTDLLVAPDHRLAAADVLGELGYERTGQFTGDLVSYQATHVARRQGRTTHVVDLHWRLANPQHFGSIVSIDELFAQSVPLPRLGPGARGLGAVHALLVACLHPVAHHAGTQRLIWSWDVHLLAGTFSDADWTAFAALADGRGVARVSASGLELARHRFRTAVPAFVLERLAAPYVSDADTARYLESGRRHIHTVLSDLRSLSTWRARWRLVRQHAFPPRRYMRDVYAPASAVPLPVLYARRVVRGAMKWLARS